MSLTQSQCFVAISLDSTISIALFHFLLYCCVEMIFIFHSLHCKLFVRLFQLCCKRFQLMQWKYWHCLLLYLIAFLPIAFLQFLMIFFNVSLCSMSFLTGWEYLYRLMTWLCFYLPNRLQLQCRLRMKQ